MAANSSNNNRGFESRRGHNMKNISVFFKDTKPLAQLVGLFFLFVIGLIIAGGIQLLFPMGTDSPTAIRGQLVMQACSQLLMFFLPAWLFGVLYHGNALSYHKVVSGGKIWLLGLIAQVIFLLLAPLNDTLTWWNNGWNFGAWETGLRHYADAANGTVEALLSLTTTGDLLLQLLVVALIPALCEELFFRGAIQQTLQRWFGNAHVAIVATALLFSLAHGDAYGLIPRFLLGLILGYLFFLSGSMIVNVCAHFFNNFLVVAMYYLYHIGVLSQSPAEPLLMPWGTVVMCTLVAIMLFAVYFLKKPSKQASKS